jgi:hypothetical protein
VHLLCRIVSAALRIVHVGCCLRHGVTVRRTLVQRDGGVLFISGGSATFESVAISDTSAAVRVAGEADRAGGRLEWRFAVWWRGEDIWWINRVQGRQHRTLFCGARSSLLTVVRVASSCMGCVVRCMVCGGMLQRVLRTMHVCLILHGVRTCCIFVLHGCRLQVARHLSSRPVGGSMLHPDVARCVVCVACSRVAHCTLDAAQCSRVAFAMILTATQLSGWRVLRVACCTLRVAMDNVWMCVA